MSPKPDYHSVLDDLDASRPLFVASDLHLGDGTTAFSRTGKDLLFNRFLDHVEREGGQLLILGDLLELWRYALEVVVHQWHGLLDRLHHLQAVYVPGNHDEAAASSKALCHHPLFARVVRPFHMQMGDKRIQFMHGHELDPFDEHGLHESNLYMRCFHAVHDVRDRVHWLTHETLADVGLGMSEGILRLWHWLTRVSSHALHPELAVATVGATPLRHVRTQKMLSRFCHHRDETSYDVAIVGHTHRVGCFNSWYFNSGCWVKPSNSFLKVHPDGHVEVFDWADRAPRANTTIILAD